MKNETRAKSIAARFAAVAVFALLLCPSLAFADDSGQPGVADEPGQPAATGSWASNAKGSWYEYSDGSYPANCWAQIAGEWYHFDAEGYRQSGWLKVDEDIDGNRAPGSDGSGAWFKLSDNGALVRGDWAKDSVGWCYLDPQTGEMWFDAWAQDSAGPCYIGHDGYCETGWFRVSEDFEGASTPGADGKGGWYFSDTSGRLQHNGWLKSSDKWYYLDLQTGEMSFDAWVRDSSGWCYVGHDGSCMSGWFRAFADCKGSETLGGDYLGAWYYANSAGVLQSGGWFKDSSGWCCLKAETGEMLFNAWAKDSSGWCYVDRKGYCVKGWFQAEQNFVGSATFDAYGEGAWYYADNDGRLVKNDWVADSVGWVWLDQDYGNAWWNSWKKDSSGWCYLGSDLYCVTNKTLSIENGRGESGHPEDGEYTFDDEGHVVL